MKFSKKRSYNSHDTSVGTGPDGRIQIDQSRGVQARCELSLNGLLRFGPKGATAEMITDHLNSRLKANYTTSDVRYALNRLAVEAVISSSGSGRGEDTVYHASQTALNRWRKLPKK